MNPLKPTLLLRHKKENLKKCSLRGLEGREDLRFYSYPCKNPLPLEGYLLLSMEGPLLSEKDRERGLLLLDGTWRYASQMEKGLKGAQELERRSLPSYFRTAYPRRQTGCDDPERGLATVEALFIAYFILGENPMTLLDHYHWKEKFLSLNREFLPFLSTRV